MPSQVIIEETRWRSFRQMNRNRPFKQLRIVTCLFVLSCVYVFFLFLVQPQQSPVYIIPLNNKKAHQYHQEQHILAIKEAERRRQVAIKREEMRQKRIRARNATMVWHKNQTLMNAFNNNNSTTNSTTTTQQQQQQESQQTSILRFVGLALSFVASVVMCSAAKFVDRVLVREPSTIETETTRQASRSRRRTQREEAFRSWARRLNRQREEQGERPLSFASLRLVVRGRDFTSGNDYEGLLQIEQEAGPAVISLFQNMGATQEEIDRCPTRILRETDDLLVQQEGKEPPHCAVCLEPYCVEQQVRTIPCFHTFHCSCIDPWLAQKATCPVCKHPAVG